MLKRVKITTFSHLFNFIFPYSCRGCGRIGKPLCDHCKKNIILDRSVFCPNCKTKIKTNDCQKCHDLPPIYLVGELNDIIGALVHDFKFQSTRSLARPLAEILDGILPATNGITKIIPLPTISKHVRERGFDHTYLIAKQLSKIRGKNATVEKILIRAKDTIQVGTDRKMRLKQASSAYEINRHISLDENATYVLLDDVWTTGASIKSALKKLQEFGVQKIIIAVLAVSSLD